MMLRATLPLLPQGFREQLVQMSHEEFSNNTSSLAATYREPPKTLGEAAGRIWGEVGCGGPADGGAGPRQHMHGNDMLCFPSLHMPPSDRCCTGRGAVCVCVFCCRWPTDHTASLGAANEQLLFRWPMHRSVYRNESPLPPSTVLFGLLLVAL